MTILVNTHLRMIFVRCMSRKDVKRGAECTIQKCSLTQLNLSFDSLIGEINIYDSWNCITNFQLEEL